MSAATAYRSTDIEVRGGRLRVGIWESDDLTPEATADRTVLAIHGVTSSHMAWSLVAEKLVAVPGTRFIAPDLRGRGRSAGLPGPWGMAQHGADLLTVTASLGQPDITAGHSMGGFVAVIAADLYPGSFGEVVLLDGGVPLALPGGIPVETVLQMVLGPAAERLRMMFADHESYRRFWRDHPAFAGAWSPAVQAYVDYDLVPAVDGADGWRSASSFEAVAQDTAELMHGVSLRAAWSATSRPTAFLRSPLGLLAEPPGLYPPAALEQFGDDHPGFAWEEVEDTNHYTLVLGPLGAQRVCDAITQRLEPRPTQEPRASR